MPKHNPGGDVTAGRSVPTCAEALCLVLLDRGTGRMPRTQQRAVRYAVAGAVLIDLALTNCIEDGSRHLRPTDPAPLGGDLLGPLLARIDAAPDGHGVASRVERTAKRAGQIRRAALDRLVARGVLAVEKNGRFGVLGARCYSVLDDDADHDLRRRLAHALSDGESPTPRDVALIRLIDACGRFEQLVPPRELKRARQRITELRAQPLAGHAIVSAVERSVAGLTPPAAPGIPVAGNAFSLTGDVRAYLTREYQRLGPVFRVRAFKRRITVLAGPEANMFLVKEGRSHLRSAEAWRDFAAELGAERAVMSMDGAEHDRMRHGLKRGYSRAAAERHIPEMIDIVRREIAAWPTDRPIPAHYALQRIATDELGILAAGTSPRDYLDDLIVFVRALLLATVTRQRPRSLLKRRSFRRARARAEELYQEVSASHDPTRRRDAVPDLIDDLLELHRADPQFLPETDLRAGVLGPFIAGLDTMAGVCSFMLYSILKHPGLLERMTAEADAVFANGGPTVQDIRKLDVTHRVALETMRMYPTAPALSRTVSNSFELGGYRLNAGDQVLMAVSVPHYLPRYFPDPERFDIDRYAPPRNEHHQVGVFAPFGLGSHTCLGAGFAEVGIAVTMATLVHEAELTLDPPDYDLKIDPIPIAHPTPSFKFRMKRRKPPPNQTQTSGPVARNSL